MSNDWSLIRCEMVDGSGFVSLPAADAEHFAKLGRVRLPTPQPDQRYGKPQPTPLAQTWGAAGFTPTGRRLAQSEALALYAAPAGVRATRA